ncbi:AHH domain-containing protein [Melittangium boletus]|uniref:Uncharacterized protein n=1 Tax=Melittangium boletus DSM 14713 TaxID=1294270 RepID=A0A250IS68_9BACT|nr:AHH domain-containing protein [Melittangium boletus]ATB34082.1 hypothetical protein MEBOL_007583 [Melittangium boletus DSM 14713]
MSTKRPDPLREAFAQYKEKADNARRVKEEAKQARQLANKTLDSEKLEKAAENAEGKAATAEKNRHMAKLKTKDTHQPGEENGCVTRCVWAKSRPDDYRRKCLFDGHNHKENAIEYHVANERHWYNLRFHKHGPPRQRLEAALGFKYKPKPTDTKQDRKAGKKLEVGMRMAGRKNKNNPLVTPGAWDMGMSGNNFWSGRKQPWAHEAHHIIPTDVLYRVFEEDMSLLQQLKYNINKGLNIIILPTKPLLGWVFLLPAHVNQHHGYSAEVKQRVESVRKAAGKQQEKKEGHPDMSEAQNKPWKSQFENHSKRLRKILRKEGLREGLSGKYKYLALDDVFKSSRNGPASALG